MPAMLFKYSLRLIPILERDGNPCKKINKLSQCCPIALKPRGQDSGAKSYKVRI